MKKRNNYFVLIFFLACIAYAFDWHSTDNAPILEDDLPLQEVMDFLGNPSPHASPSVGDKRIENGKNLVLYGLSTNENGNTLRKQSKHFVCTSCHNIKKDMPNLNEINPSTKLDYAIANDLPFLQGSSLYGIVNRTKFYNGDYQKKYSFVPTIKAANTDLEEAIQVCAVECSQGRKLKDWELENVMAYLWTLQLKVGDLNINTDDLKKLQDRLNALDLEDDVEKEKIVQSFKSYYLEAIPANFVEPPSKRDYEVKGDASKGAKIYELSCLHCHEDSRYSWFSLGDDDLSKQFLDKHFPNYGRYSTYQVARYGAPSYPGKRAYMPQYPVEKLSVQQLEDLRKYLSTFD